MVQSIRDKICQMLERNENAISKDDYARLVVYIDLLFDFAQGYETVANKSFQITK